MTAGHQNTGPNTVNRSTLHSGSGWFWSFSALFLRLFFFFFDRRCLAIRREVLKIFIPISSLDLKNVRGDVSVMGKQINQDIIGDRLAEVNHPGVGESDV